MIILGWSFDAVPQYGMIVMYLIEFLDTNLLKYSYRCATGVF